MRYKHNTIYGFKLYFVFAKHTHTHTQLRLVVNCYLWLFPYTNCDLQNKQISENNSKSETSNSQLKTCDNHEI